MSEITEQEATQAAARIQLRQQIDIDDADINDLFARADDWKLVNAWAMQELSRRDAAQAARQQPVTPEWCLANGAFYREPYYVFDDSVRVTVRPIGRGDTWLVFIDERMIDDWSAKCVGQIEDLRKALRGGGA